MIISGNHEHYIVTYRHEGKIVKNAKIYCKYHNRPIYILENLDRGDGVRLDVDVASQDDSAKIAKDIAPGYMSFAIDSWLQTCK